MIIKEISKSVYLKKTSQDDKGIYRTVNTGTTLTSEVKIRDEKELEKASDELFQVVKALVLKDIQEMLV
jgi:hypothetical protein